MLNTQRKDPDAEHYDEDGSFREPLIKGLSRKVKKVITETVS